MSVSYSSISAMSFFQIHSVMHHVVSDTWAGPGTAPRGRIASWLPKRRHDSYSLTSQLLMR